MYLLPAAGALLLIGSGLARKAGLIIQLVAIVLAGAVTLPALLALIGKPGVGLGPGSWVALFGLTVGSGSVIVSARTVCGNPRPPIFVRTDN